MNFDAEVASGDDSGKAKVHERLRNHLKEVYQTTNPSTGESYLFQEEGSDSPFVSPANMPRLKDCRGKIVIYGTCGDVSGLTRTTGGLSAVKDSTSNSVPADEKIEQLEKYFKNNSYKLTTNANDHLNYSCAIDTNSKAPDDDWKLVIKKSMQPLRIVSEVHPTLFGDGKVFNNEDTAGRYFGWVKLDGATYDNCRLIYSSNFFDGLEYVTVTVKPSANAGASETQTYRLLKYTDITIPECIYDPDAERGGFINWMMADSKGNLTAYEPGDAFEVDEDVTFIAQWDNDKTAQAKVY